MSYLDQRCERLVNYMEMRLVGLGKTGLRAHFRLGTGNQESLIVIESGWSSSGQEVLGILSNAHSEGRVMDSGASEFGDRVQGEAAQTHRRWFLPAQVLGQGQLCHCTVPHWAGRRWDRNPNASCESTKWQADGQAWMQVVFRFHRQ